MAAGDADPADIERASPPWSGGGRRLIHEGVARTDIVLQRSIDMMYSGQWRSLAVDAPSPIGAIGDLVARFHAEHQRANTISAATTRR